MRVVLAGLFVVAGMGGAVALLSRFGFDQFPPLVIAVVMCLTLFTLIGLAVVLFSPDGLSCGSTLKDLEEKGLLVSTPYRATRAFQVDEWEDEGSHYFIELEDGSVLYLNGQYLYEYEEIEDDDDEFKQPRRFPCTEFTIRRHRTAGFVADIACGGEVLEPEELQPAFTNAEFRSFNLGDGEIIRDRTYDQIKNGRLRARP